MIDPLSRYRNFPHNWKPTKPWLTNIKTNFANLMPVPTRGTESLPMPTLHPTSNHIHAQPIPTDKIGHIYLTQKLQFSMELGKPRLMRVLATGPGKLNKKSLRIPIEAHPGDKILVHSYTDGPMDLPDGTVILTDDQILAVLPQNPESPLTKPESVTITTS